MDREVLEDLDNGELGRMKGGGCDHVCADDFFLSEKVNGFKGDPHKMTKDTSSLTKTGSAPDDYVLLGNNGLRVSPLCLGAMGLGSNYEESKKVFDHYFKKAETLLSTKSILTNDMIMFLLDTTVIPPAVTTLVKSFSWGIHCRCFHKTWDKLNFLNPICRSADVVFLAGHMILI
ncbi:hypothetical protein RhiirB3_476040 [Rhizophagus irregularis]|nr:hypothetical protein RhiirB3_476040 [Rhizophagus irregularis]